MARSKDITRQAVFAAFDLWKQVGDISQLPEYDRTLVLVWSLIGIIPGEGLGDFYETATAAFRDENVASLERIGAYKAASILRRANEIFNAWDAAHAARTAREWELYRKTGKFVAETNDLSQSGQDELDKLENDFCNLLGEVRFLLDRYVERHCAH